ncbi:MAG: transferrin-binding protein-like solute binding protein [Novosphingobium sp.]
MNATLLDPLVSETFRNAAVLGRLSVPTSGANGTSSAPAVTLTVAYNAANQSYTVSDGSLSQTFLPSQIDAAQSNSVITTYKITSGTTTDFLTLTKTGTGAGQTRYVASGFWQRQVNGAATIDGRFYAFTYGVNTPGTAMPRTGTASFDVKLLGAESFSANVYSLNGTGTMVADFLSGGIHGRGFYSRTDSQTGMPAGNGLGWQVAALLSSANDSFAGVLKLDGVGDGSFKGNFFGPAAEEIGGVFAINPNNDQLAVGSIYGPRGTALINSGTFSASLNSHWFFKPISSSLRGAIDPANVLSTVASTSPLASIYYPQNGGNPVMYRADGQITRPFPAAFGPASSYTILGDLGASPAQAGWQINQGSGVALYDAFVFGSETAFAAVPRTGTASFGVGLNGAVANVGSKLQTLSGTGSLSANFASGTIATDGTWKVVDTIPNSTLAPGTQVDSGTWAGSGTIASAANSLSGNITLTGGKTYSGALAGKFFGAAAESVGATFSATAANGAIAVGSLVGGRGTDNTAAQQGLAALTSSTVLPGSETIHAYSPAISPPNSAYNDADVSVTYDPTNNSYVLKSNTTAISYADLLINQTLTAAMIDAGKSNATFTAYSAPSLEARVFKVGAGNPALALTYASFAEITKPVTSNGQNYTATYYVPFGGVTPSYQMPSTGSAVYNGVVYGKGGGANFGTSSSMSGTSVFNVNFGTGQGSLALTVSATDAANVLQSIGTFTYAGPLGSFCGSTCQAQNRWFLPVSSTTLTNNFWTGTANGNFFGVNAAEYGASFFMRFTPNGQSSDATFAGVTMGKKN